MQTTPRCPTSVGTVRSTPARTAMASCWTAQRVRFWATAAETSLAPLPASSMSAPARVARSHQRSSPRGRAAQRPAASSSTRLRRADCRALITGAPTGPGTSTTRQTGRTWEQLASSRPTSSTTPARTTSLRASMTSRGTRAAPRRPSPSRHWAGRPTTSRAAGMTQTTAQAWTRRG